VRIGSLDAGLALVAVLAACEGSTAPSEAPAKQTFHPPAGDLLGLIWKGDSAELAELDPRTLAPGSRRFPVEKGAATLIAFSADGKTLALGAVLSPRSTSAI
jgi:hypothetical protein